MSIQPDRLTGAHIVGGQVIAACGDHFHAYDPSAGEDLAPAFAEADEGLVAQAAETAASAQPVYANSSRQQRAGLLQTIAEQLQAGSAAIIARAQQETALPQARLKGEMARTCGQLQMFADYLRTHQGYEVIDPAQPQRQPQPRPELRQRQLPIGPVAVFGASNFPLAFSVAGGDTAAALAAGCAVVVKGHPAHPGTSELVASVVAQAVKDNELPSGVFSLLQSTRPAVAQALVRHSAIRATAFTGSLQGGRALMDAAASRPDPIPVFAEMGSINPVFLLPGALTDGTEAIARGFVQSLTQGEGQFCTNPGLLVAIESAAYDRFVEHALGLLGQHQGAAMLTPGICQAYQRQLAKQLAADGVVALGYGAEPNQTGAARACLLSVAVADWLDQAGLQDEVFGPASVLLRCRNRDHMMAVAQALQGQLSATMHAVDQDRELALSLMSVLEHKAGRVVFNGFPTGVEVAAAMVHGGPWPAASDGRSTSVGLRAMDRFLRLVCYQNVPAGWLEQRPLV